LSLIASGLFVKSARKIVDMTYPGPGIPRLSDVLAEQIRLHRKIQKLSQGRLASRCREIGAPEITVDVVHKIEAGERASGVRMDEWPSFAMALGVSPMALLLPETNSAVEITRVCKMQADVLYRWLVGQRNPFGRTVSLATWLPYLTNNDTVLFHDGLELAARQIEGQTDAD
jgi:hypothetical protein